MSISRELPSKLSDDEVVMGVKAGRIPRNRGVEELITRHATSLWRYLKAHYSSVDEEYLKEAVAETASIIWEKFEQYRPGEDKFLGWALVIARNKLLEILRKEKKYISLDAITGAESTNEESTRNIYEVLAISEQALLEDEIDYEETEKKVLEFVMSLPELDRTLFLLKSNYNLSYKELADILNKSGEMTTPGAIAQRFSRVRKKLRRLFKDE